MEKVGIPTKVGKVASLKFYHVHGALYVAILCSETTHSTLVYWPSVGTSYYIRPQEPKARRLC